MIVLTSDNKNLYLCRAPGCGTPFTNQAGRRNHETTIHSDICDSFKGQKGEILHFKSTQLRDKAKKKIRDDLKKANGATPPTPKKTVKKEAPAPETKPPAPAPQDPKPDDVEPLAAAAPPATPGTPAKPDSSHHNPNPKKKDFWKQASDWWEGKPSEEQ